MPRKVDGLHVRELDSDVVVVDGATQQAHALSGTAAQLWRGIDAGSWPEAPDADLDRAVSELQGLGLVEATGMSRRALLARAGTVAIAGTVITIGLPMSSAAASGQQSTATTPAAPANPPQGTNFVITVTVAPAPGGGDVTLVNTTTGATIGTQPVAGGSIPFTVTAGTAGSTDTFTATYTGDLVSAGSTGTVDVTYGAVVAQLPDPVITGSAPTETRKNKKSSITFTVDGTAGAGTGTVTFTATAGVTPTTATATLVGGQATFDFTNPGPPDGTSVTVTCSFPGDVNYTAGSGTVTFTTT